MAVGERLKQAIETHAGISIREFHRRMGPDGRGVSGASYPNIHRYLKHQSEPSLEFLRQAAEECGVRQEWLIAGAGLPTEEEVLRLARLTDPELEPAGGLERAAMTSLMEATPDFVKVHLIFEYRHLSAVTIKIAKRILDDDRVARYRRAGRLVGECIAAPLAVLGVEHVRFGPDSRTMQAYVTAVAHAVEIISAHAQPQSPRITEED